MAACPRTMSASLRINFTNGKVCTTIVLMAEDQPNWQDAAKAVYRLAQTELLAKSAYVTDDESVGYYIEELREALLDLKQALIDDRVADAMVSMDEIALYLAELKRRRGKS